MRVTVLLLALVSALASAADNEMAVTKAATSPKPQTTSCGAEAITIPQMLSYQGELADTLGQSVPDTTYSLTLRLYTVPTGGTQFWSETQIVRTRAGLFNVLLGSVTPIGVMPAAGAVYLGMAVGGGTELTPRLRIVSAAYAYKADTANYALASGSTDNAWTRGSGDSVLYTLHELGIARGGASNKLWGDSACTHVNLGVACTTGLSGQAYRFATVGGGFSNSAESSYATVGGGSGNESNGPYSTVPGGYGALTSHYGEFAHANGNFANHGDAQASEYVLRAQGSGDVTLTLDGAAPGTGNGLRVAQNRDVVYDILVVVNANSQAGGFHVQCVVKDVGGSTYMVGSPVVTTIASEIPTFNVWAWVENNAVWVGAHSDFEARWVATVRTAELNW